MTRARRCIEAVARALAVIALLESVAAAQSSVAAEALFRAGRKASAQGDHVAACAKYRESYRIEQALGTLLNIAVCEEALGELASAWQRYQELVHALDPGDTRRAMVRSRLQALERRVPFITVHVAEGASDFAQVEIGATQLTDASFGVALPLDPGAHELRVLARGHATRSYEFAIAEGERRTLDVEVGEPVEEDEPEPELAPAPPPEPSLPVAPPAPPLLPSSAPADYDTERLLSYGALGLGAGALALSGVSLIAAIERKNVVDAHCDGGGCDDVGSSAGRAGRAWLTVSWISAAVGVVSVAVGAYGLWATDRGAMPSASYTLDGSGFRMSF